MSVGICIVSGIGIGTAIGISIGMLLVWLYWVLSTVVGIDIRTCIGFAWVQLLVLVLIRGVGVGTGTALTPSGCLGPNVLCAMRTVTTPRPRMRTSSVQALGAPRLPRAAEATQCAHAANGPFSPWVPHGGRDHARQPRSA